MTIFKGTFEHGYADAVSGRQRLLGCDAYREGYDRGVRYMKSQKAIELAAVGILTMVVVTCLFLWITVLHGVTV